MFDVVFTKLMTLVHHNVTHVEVGVSRTYTVWVAVIKEVALRHKKSFRSLDSAVHVQFPVSDDELWHDGGLERDIAPATLLYSPIVFAQNEEVGVLVQFPVDFWVVASTPLVIHSARR